MPIGINGGLTVPKSTSLIKAFISNFVSPDFFSNIVKLCLYPEEFSVSTLSNNNSTICYIQEYLKDICFTVNNLKMQNSQQIKEYTSLLNTIFNIRESGKAYITYSNVYQHLPSINLTQRSIIQQAIDNQLQSKDDFRLMLDKVIGDINVYNEICSISFNILEFDNLSERISNPSTSPHEAAKLYKDTIIKQYNILSQLKSVNKLESEKDYFVISDKKSIKELANTLVSYITSDYSFYGTGYHLFDKNIEGLTYISPLW